MTDDYFDDQLIPSFKSVTYTGGPKMQTDPPSIPVSELFADGNFPEGEICKYPVDQDKYVQPFVVVVKTKTIRVMKIT